MCAANRCGEERAVRARANRSSERDQPPLGELLGKGAWSSTHRGSAAAVRVVGEARPKLIACEPLHARRTRGTDDELRGGVDLLGSRRCGAGARQGRAGIAAHRSSPETQLRRGRCRTETPFPGIGECFGTFGTTRAGALLAK